MVPQDLGPAFFLFRGLTEISRIFLQLRAKLFLHSDDNQTINRHVIMKINLEMLRSFGKFPPVESQFREGTRADLSFSRDIRIVHPRVQAPRGMKF